MRFGNFLAGAWSMAMAYDLHTLMLGTDPVLQGWLGFAVWAIYIAAMYALGAIHAFQVPRR